MIKRVAVFCGSGSGTKIRFKETAYALGRSLAEHGLELVYGGSRTGLMGALSDGVIDNKGEAIGVLPGFLKDREVAHPRLSRLILVEDMHQRKAKMHELADAFIILPGGLGTLEECFEILTWSQLDIHNKPVVLLSIDNFYDPLLTLMDHIADHGFIKDPSSLFSVFHCVEETIKHIKDSDQIARI